MIQDVQKVDGLAKVAEKRLLEEKLVRRGDVIGIVAGTPMGIRGTTNFMKFHVIGGPTRELTREFALLIDPAIGPRRRVVLLVAPLHFQLPAGAFSFPVCV